MNPMPSPLFHTPSDEAPSAPPSKSIIRRTVRAADRLASTAEAIAPHRLVVWASLAAASLPSAELLEEWVWFATLRAPWGITAPPWQAAILSIVQRGLWYGILTAGLVLATALLRADRKLDVAVARLTRIGLLAWAGVQLLLAAHHAGQAASVLLWGLSPDPVIGQALIWLGHLPVAGSVLVLLLCLMTRRVARSVRNAKAQGWRVALTAAITVFACTVAWNLPALGRDATASRIEAESAEQLQSILERAEGRKFQAEIVLRVAGVEDLEWQGSGSVRVAEELSYEGEPTHLLVSLESKVGVAQGHWVRWDLAVPDYRDDGLPREARNSPSHYAASFYWIIAAGDDRKIAVEQFNSESPCVVVVEVRLDAGNASCRLSSTPERELDFRVEWRRRGDPKQAA